MSQFTSVLNLIKTGIQAFGILWVVWGGVTLGIGLKDKTAPEIKQGFGTLIGGAIVYFAANLISNINIG